MATKATSILLVEDSRLQREIMRAALGRLGYDVACAGSAEEALAEFARGKFDVLLADVLLPEMSGVELMERVRGLDPDQCVILMTAEGSGTSALEALGAGADDYVTKPLPMEHEGLDLAGLIARAREHARLRGEVRVLRAQLAEVEPLRATLTSIRLAAQEMSQPLTVLIGAVDLLKLEGQAGLPAEIEVIERTTQRLSDSARRLAAITAVAEVRPQGGAR